MTSTRRAFLAALALGPAAEGLRRAEAQTEGTRAPLSTLWSRPVPNLVGLTVSPDGERVVCVAADGTVRCFDRLGSFLWQQTVAEADTVVCSRSGNLILAFGTRRPFGTDVHFLDSSGRDFYTLPGKEMVQAAVLSGDGELAAVASGKRIVLCHPVGETVRRLEISLAVEPRDIQFGPGDSVYVVGRQPESVFLVKSTGRVLWDRAGSAGTNFSIWSSQDGGRLAIGSQKTADTLEVSLVDAHDNRRWTVALPGRAPKVRLSADGTAVMLVYEHRLEHQAVRRYERRLAYIAGGLEGAWPKGGPFTAPLAVALAAHGEWTVALDTQSQIEPPCFRLYARDGKRLWKYTPVASVMLATSSLDGRSIAAYRTDGVLELIRVNAPG